MGNLNSIILVTTHHDLQKLSSDAIFRNRCNPKETPNGKTNSTYDA